MLRQDRSRTGRVGPGDANLDVQTAGAQDSRIDELLAVRGADDDDIARGLHTIELGEQLRDCLLYTSPSPRD